MIACVPDKEAKIDKARRSIFAYKLYNRYH
jgi:hypothetical protein